MKYPLSILVLASFSLALPMLAQMPEPKPAQTPAVVGSTVSGTVFCSDSNAPARFAKVLLTPAVPSHAGDDFMKDMENFAQKVRIKSGGPATLSPQQQRAMARGAQSLDRTLAMINATTVGLDGRYSFSAVKPGTYYIHVIYSGYIDTLSQFSQADLTSTDPAVRARLARISTVTVNGSDSRHVDLTLSRGVSISGRVTYADGTPAVGWTVSAVKPGPGAGDYGPTDLVMERAMAQGGGMPVTETDDMGRYRISGLAPGGYLVRAGFTAPPVGISGRDAGDGGTGIFLVVYSGNVFSAELANTLTLTAGEDLRSADIAIPNDSLHNIVGHVYAKSDGHTLNAGRVVLTSQAQPSLRLVAAIRDDGSFHFQYLPGDVTYTLEVEDAADGKSTPGKVNMLGINIPHMTILRKYGTSTLDIPLGNADIDAIRLTVAQTRWTPPPAGSCKPCTSITPGDLVNGILGAGSSEKPKP